MRQIEDLVHNPDVERDDLITIYLALQRQNYALSNTIKNLVKEWPTSFTNLPTTKEGTSLSGTSSETKS